MYSIDLQTVFYEYQNKNLKILHFEIRGKLSIIRCDKYILNYTGTQGRAGNLTIFFVDLVSYEDPLKKSGLIRGFLEFLRIAEKNNPNTQSKFQVADLESGP